VPVEGSLQLSFEDPPVLSATGFPEFEEDSFSTIRGRATLFDGKHLAAVLRVNALWRLRCRALAVLGVEEREPASLL
jgi:hypothetical protein